ncbi:MAG: zinc-binding dehydrogenase [Planctomycetota bacterium]
MKAIVNTAPDCLEIREMPLPHPGAGQVRIKTAACAICTTDLEMIAGWERTGFPAIPGHEWSGVVDATGPNVDKALVGRKCVAENVLSDGGEVGFEHPGGYAEYFLTQFEKIHVLPDNFSMTVASLIEPLAVTVRAIRRFGGDPHEPVLIFGDGPIGLLLLLLLNKRRKKHIIVVGGRDKRLDLAADFGATETLNYHNIKADLAEAIQNHGYQAFSTIVDASGTVDGVNAALKLIEPCGKILLVGDYGQNRGDFAWNYLVQREIELIGSNASKSAWPEAVQLAVEGNLPLGQLISHRYPVSKYNDGIELVRRRDKNVVKIVLQWEE